MKELTHLDLFSGIGGFALAAQAAGFKTVAFCEIDSYAQKILRKNFHAVLANALPAAQRRQPQQGQIEIHADIRKLDGTQYSGISILTAGVPCQPASCAGQRRGPKDDRWLWPEALRIFHETHPAFAVFENPTGILALNGGVEFERLLLAMENEGYSVQPIIVPACAVDARHRRDRVWIVAHATNARNGDKLSERTQTWNQTRLEPAPGGPSLANSKLPRSQGRHGQELPECSDQWTARTSSPLPHTGCLNGNARSSQVSHEEAQWRTQGQSGRCSWIEEAQSGVCRVADGIPNRIHRLRSLGNAIVPQVAYQILKPIAQILRGEL